MAIDFRRLDISVLEHDVYNEKRAAMIEGIMKRPAGKLKHEVIAEVLSAELNARKKFLAASQEKESSS